MGSDFAGLAGVGPTLLPEDLAKYIRADQGLNAQTRAHLLTIINTPDIAGHLLTGATGAAIALAVARWRKMSGSSQVLMGLAGFGLGNIILNKLSSQGKHTMWNPENGKNRILL